MSTAPAPAPPNVPQAVSNRLRELPVCDPQEIDRAVGFVRFVRVMVAMPLMTLGLLGTAAGVAGGNWVLGGISGAITGLIWYSLGQDTRLTKAFDALRRGDLGSAKSGLLALTGRGASSTPQRHRAQTYLAAIAWRQGRHQEALRWIEDRLRTAPGARTPRDELFLLRATHAQLLAVIGDPGQALEVLAKLGPPPADDFHRLVDITSRLLVAFGAGDADLVANRLDEWREVALRYDDLGVALSLLAWAYDGVGARDRAFSMVHAARRVADQAHLAKHYPTLQKWLERFDRRLRFG